MDRSSVEPTERSKAGSDFLQLDATEAAGGGRSTWLVDRVREAIGDGRLGVDAVLPATRVLAADLGLSRGVVSEAYRRLADEGLISGAGRRGTVVLGTPVRRRQDAVPLPLPLVADPRASADEFARLRAAEVAVDLSPGVPDLAAFPRAAWLRAERAVLEGVPSRALGYADPRGTLALRTAVADWLARTRGIRAEPGEVQVVAGVAQGISLLTSLLAQDGIGSIAVEDPGSLGARQQLAAGGLATPPVPVDGEGLDVHALVASGERVVMATPAHQFPTGVVLSGARRLALSEWVHDGGLVFEDDYDAEHRYDRPPVAALRATLPDGVYYAGSVSKLLAPALRIGWVLPPPSYRDRLTALKRDDDLGNATLAQLVLAQLMTGGDLERHLRQVRRRHRRRRDLMVDGLARCLPTATVHGAAAGLHLTVTLPADVDDVALAVACLDQGVKVQPLSWHRQTVGAPGLVLGYAASSPAVLDQGLETIGRVLRGLG